MFEWLRCYFCGRLEMSTDHYFRSSSLFKGTSVPLPTGEILSSSQVTGQTAEITTRDWPIVGLLTCARAWKSRRLHKVFLSGTDRLQNFPLLQS